MAENMDWRLTGHGSQESAMRSGKVGRCVISMPFNGKEGRMHFSMRAMKGTISVVKIPCPHCHHHKSIRNESPMSPFYDRVKCARCKKTIEV